MNEQSRNFNPKLLALMIGMLGITNVVRYLREPDLSELLMGIGMLLLVPGTLRQQLIHSIPRSTQTAGDKLAAALGYIGLIVFGAGVVSLFLS